MSKKDTKGIPKGQYCYTNNMDDEHTRCPYWRIIKNRPNQYNGWCDYLEKGDLEIEKEMIFIEEKTGKNINGFDLPFPVSLLWDQCKECGINI